MTSCLRVARVAAAVGATLLGGGADTDARRSWLLRHFGRATPGASSCSVAGEVCCAFDVTADEYAVVWSLGLDSGGDAMPSALPAEVQVSRCGKPMGRRSPPTSRGASLSIPLYRPSRSPVAAGRSTATPSQSSRTSASTRLSLHRLSRCAARSSSVRVCGAASRLQERSA